MRLAVWGSNYDWRHEKLINLTICSNRNIWGEFEFCRHEKRYTNCVGHEKLLMNVLLHYSFRIFNNFYNDKDEENLVWRVRSKLFQGTDTGLSTSICGYE